MNFNNEEKKLILQFNPFEGDYGDGEVHLEDKIVIARKQHECFYCNKIIKPLEQYRHKVEIYDGFQHFKWCNECCQAMLKYIQFIYLDSNYLDTLTDKEYDKLQNDCESSYSNRLNLYNAKLKII